MKLLERIVEKILEHDSRLKDLEKKVSTQEDLIKDLFYRYREIVDILENAR